MTDKSKKPSKKTVIAAGAIGSAAVVAALLYASKRKENKGKTPTPPSGENPETD